MIPEALDTALHLPASLLQPDILVNKHGSYLAPSKELPRSFQAVSTSVLKMVCVFDSLSV